ncbi:serine/threonine protein kinase [Murinocardiopsis flavida]|uniref:Serine/threonine protein kinase n=1 Tax=Murinocardiopsis flavida TaxID=645275 RepID=A0A2P8DH16_9ACTN|nr:serine/threonine-protein kinase [Murinocardiopsis flavida]PSK96515.1 serine/threonine protein kinase [Murinocardiopsis flavida]
MNEADPLHDSDPAALGRYTVLGRLGEGGQGTVYMGEGPDGDRVAIKTLNGQAVDSPAMRQRFVREADAARQVASFCTAAVLAADFDAHPPYIVSEFVEGPSLKQRVESEGPLAPGDLNRLAVAIANALVAIHEAGIVHRDLKPANVLLGPGGARVIDFGIAQDTRGVGTLTNSSIGTPAFMAPEQIEGRSLSPAADVFAWGAVMAFAATGVSPFQGPSIPTILHQVLSVEPDVSGVPEPLRGPVIAALAKDPAARPSSVDLLMGLLGRKERPAGHDAVTAVLRESAGAGTAGAAAVAGATAAAGTTAGTGTTAAASAADAPTVAGASPHGPPGPGPGPVPGSGSGSGSNTDPTLNATALTGQHASGPNGPGANGSAPPGAPAPRKRSAALVVGGIAVVLILILTGLAAYAIGRQGGPGGPDADASPTPSKSAPPTVDRQKAAEHTGAAVPKFTEDFSGEWEGAVAGRIYTLDVDQGERTADLSDDGDDSCSYDFEIREAVVQQGERRYFTSAEGDEDECPGSSAVISLNRKKQMSVEVYRTPSAKQGQRGGQQPAVKVPALDPVEE